MLFCSQLGALGSALQEWSVSEEEESRKTGAHGKNKGVLKLFQHCIWAGQIETAYSAKIQKSCTPMVSYVV